MKTIAFFNNRGGAGKTTLVYHLAWMFADMGRDVVAADLDPQSNLTSMFLDETRLEELWPEEGNHPETIQGVVEPVLRGVVNPQPPHVEQVTDLPKGSLGLIPGDPGLSQFEEQLPDTSIRTMTAFYRVIRAVADSRPVDLVLIDLGPNLGAINRSALVASDCVIVPLTYDLPSVQGLTNLGPQLRQWREAWNKVRSKSPDAETALPPGDMRLAGYVVTQHGARGGRPVKAHPGWVERIPYLYRRSMLVEFNPGVRVETDPYCLAVLKDYRSLAPLAVEARKPMFWLKPADGAIGAHVQAVRDCYAEFHHLAGRIETTSPCVTGPASTTLR